ncbi:MAG: cadherin repeat domain-containing protein, partial [Planctomycetaceae bacterium]|nr:cadherin repeat domain-containing protein [Planctomycetaceae bacterium]
MYFFKKLKNSKSLKNLLNHLIPQQRTKKTRPQGWQSRRLAHFEMLESRELLSVNVLGPVTAYAQPNNPAEIQFDLTTNGNIATKFDFTVQRANGSTLDPSQLRLINRANGQSMVLSDSVNGTALSSASATLATGSYSVFVSADAGKGNFTFVISQESQIKSGLDILVMAAIAQQQQPAGWANRVSYYNNLLANTSYAGAASVMPIAKYYPEVDVDGDGKIDLTDSTAAQQKASSATGTVTSHSVTAHDPVPETIQDSGNGNVKVPSNHLVQSVSGQSLQTGQSKTLANGQGTITLKTDGSLEFTPNESSVTKLAAGETETVTIPVTTKDVYGNEYSFSAVFTLTGQNELPVLSNATPVSLTFNQTANNSGTIKTTDILTRWTDPDRGAKLSVVNPVIQSASVSNPELNSKYTPATLQQYLSLTASGVTFTVSDSFFNDLGLNETLTITVSYGIKDEYGQSPNTGILQIIVNGKDNPSVLTASQKVFQIISNDISNPVKTVNAGFSVTDSDRKDATGFVYSFSNVKDNSSDADNELITQFNTSTGTFNIDTSKLKNRSVNSTVKLNVSVKSISGGIVSETLTINLNPLATPVVSNLVLLTTETTQKTGKVTPTVAGTKGFKTTGLTVVSANGSDVFSNSVSLATVATLSENGDFVFTPDKNFEYLKLNETLKLKFQYTSTDTQYGLTGLGTIELTITGTVTIPTGPSNQTIGANGEFNATENNGTVPQISVPKSVILNDWTLPDGLDAYSIIVSDKSNPVLFEQWSGGTTNPLDSVPLGSVNIDSSGNLVFYPVSGSYKELGYGQWLEVAVPVSVRDASGLTYSVGKVLFRIHGANNVPELTCQYDKFDFALNSKDSVSINPVFTTNDPDLNDQANLLYSIDSNSENLGFVINSNGIISIPNENKKLLNGDYTIIVSLKDNYGGTATKDINVHIFKESNPTVSETTVAVTEKEAFFTKDLNTAISKQTKHSYSFTTPELKQILFNENDYVFDLKNEYYTFNLATGEFKFNTPSNLFDFLTTDDTLSFRFEYTVSDDGYENCESTGSFIVNIMGVNDSPVQISGQDQNIEPVTESINAQLVTISDLLNGWKDSDHSNEELIISDVNINGLIGNTLIQPTDLQNVVSKLFTVSENKKDLQFNPAHEIFRKLGYGENVTLIVGYTVRDPKGGSGTGNFTITVNGHNDPPTLDFDNFVWQFKESDEEEIIDLRKYITDLDENDSHCIIKINERPVSVNGLITLDSGATVTYLGDLRIKYELNSSFECLSEGDTKTENLSITITDSNDNGIST